MSDGMAFLTGAAFAGVAVLFMLKGGAGANLGATNVPISQPLQIAQSNPTNPYITTSPTPLSPTPGATFSSDQQRVESDRMRAVLDQQRIEIEQLKAQLQNQQSAMERLTTQTDPNARSTWSKPAVVAAPQQQQQDNPILSGIVWALGGMAITVSGGVVVLGALSVLSRQQRPSRTTYVVQQPYNALPPSPQVRRRTEVMPPQLDERRVDYVEYDR